MDNLRRLEEMSMVRRFRDPDDGRIVRVQVTDKGRVLREKSMVAVENVNLYLLKGLSKADQKALLLGLDEIARAADTAIETTQ